MSHVLFSASVLPHSSASVPQAVDLLRQGKLVVVPTETVYGIAFNMRSSEARVRMKGLRSSPSPWVLHVPSAEVAVARYLPELSPPGMRLIRRAWPGPVALQVQLSVREQELLSRDLGEAAGEALLPTSPLPAATFRCPDVSITLEILAGCYASEGGGFPVAIVGASQPGMPPATEVTNLPAALIDKDEQNGGVDAIIDAGPTRYRKASTLVALEGEGLSVLRPGVIDERIIHRLADMLILFICSGNTCRSPMAAGLARKVLAERLGTSADQLAGRHIVVQSAGLYASRGMRATPEAVTAAGKHGVDISGHASQPATADLLRRADLIYTMTEAHREEILDAVPGSEKKTFRLDPEADVDDPIGYDEAVYQQVADHLLEVLGRRLSEISL